MTDPPETIARDALNHLGELAALRRLSPDPAAEHQVPPAPKRKVNS